MNLNDLRLDLEIYRGITFGKVFAPGQATIVYKPITAITNGAPVQITAVGHGLPALWPVKIRNVLGMLEINSDRGADDVADETLYLATKVDADHLQINSVDASGFEPYVSGGMLSYNLPLDFAGLTATMEIAQSRQDTAALLVLTSTPAAGITLDNVSKLITVQASRVQTAGLDVDRAVYELKLLDGGGIATLIAWGDIRVTREVPPATT